MTSTHNIFSVSQTQIGNTLYIVKTLPSERASETAEQKLVRLVKARVLGEIKRTENTAFISQKP